MGKMGDKGRASGGGLGLASLEETLEYCYYVAGTVGEMLTRLFQWYSPAIAERSAALEPRAVAFGNVLQLTNILKDVREELDRLTAHVDSARTLLQQPLAGRKLDFLMQEFMREANTLCSKSATTPLTGIGLELKAVIEQLREQVQNVE